MNRTRKQFTDDEINILASNPYTFHVTPGQIAFTKAFKELFWERYSQGISPWEIFPDCGYDTDILGDKRIEGIRYIIKKEFMDYGEFYNGRRPSTLKTVANTDKSMTPEKKVQQLEEKVIYLEQQMEFLKKILSSKTSRK